MQQEKYEVELEFTEPVLGTVPKDKEVYASYIATKAPSPNDGKEEVQTVQEVEEKGWTGFMLDEKGIFIYDYAIRGFLKSAAQALKPQIEVKNYRGHIDQAVFVFPRKIHFLQKGKPVKEVAGCIERPLRGMTKHGPRVTLARSDYLKAGVRIKFELVVLPGHVTEKNLREWFGYAELSGFGQFRNGSYGRARLVFFGKQKNCTSQ